MIVINGQKYYKIGEVSVMLGVSIDTLRRWDRWGWFIATRTPNGTRIYHYKSVKKVLRK